MKIEMLLDKKQFSQGGFLFLFFFFSLTIGLGILTAQRLQILPIAQGEMTPLSLGGFIINFLIASIFFLLIFFFSRKFKRKRKGIFKFLFVFATATGSLITLGVFIGDFAFLAVGLLIFLWLKKGTLLSHNLLIVFGMAGAGSLLGLRLAPETMVVLLVLFSIYDYIAVYKTKHMVKMAKEMMTQGAILGLVIPQRLADFRAPLKAVEPGTQKFFILGGGDVVFPLMFSVSLLNQSIFDSLVVAIFSLIGLAANIYFFSKQKKPIPALPLIALFSIIGFLITRLI